MSSLSIDECIFGNGSAERGSAIYIDNGESPRNLTVRNSIF